MRHSLSCAAFIGFSVLAFATIQGSIAEEEIRYHCPLPENIIDHMQPHQIERSFHDGTLTWHGRITSNLTPVYLDKVSIQRVKGNDGFLSLICTYKTNTNARVGLQANIPQPNSQCKVSRSNKCKVPQDCPLIC